MKYRIAYWVTETRYYNIEASSPEAAEQAVRNGAYPDFTKTHDSDIDITETIDDEALKQAGDGE